MRGATVPLGPAAVPSRAASRPAPGRNAAGWLRAIGRAAWPPALVLLVWQAAAWGLQREELPTALDVLRTVPVILGNPDDVLSLLASLKRMAMGLALGLLVAVPLGLAMGRSKALAAAALPLTSLAYPVPKAALMPILMLWLGVGDLSKVLVIALGVSLPLLYHSHQGASRVDEKLVWSAQAMGLGAVARLRRIVLPAALPEVLLGCRVALSIALITMISSEMIARQNGAGELLFNALDMALYTDVYAVILLIAVLGLLLDAGFERLRRRLVAWSDTLHGAPPT